MMTATTKTLNVQPTYTDEEVIVRVLTGQPALFELLIRRTNPNLYRVGRSFGYNHQDTEDLMQETHVDAYMHLGKFERRSSYSTWITRLMINRCAQKMRKRSTTFEIPTLEHAESATPVYQSNYADDPSQLVMKNELSRLIENALVELPVNYRVVFTLRELNQLSVAETAASLGITEDNVKVRLNRAKAVLRKKIEETYQPEDIYDFNLVYCDAIVNRVMQRIQALTGDDQTSL
jgi:RNA polymerase sigma factor (sigma-70 family)